MSARRDTEPGAPAGPTSSRGGAAGRSRALWTLLALSLVCNVLGAAGAVAIVSSRGGWTWLRHKAPDLLGTRPLEGKRPQVPSTTLSVYGVLRVAPGDIVLLGDDLLADAEWHELLADPRARNRAIADDDTRAVLARLAPIVAGRPRHVVLSCGGADLRTGVPPAATAERYARIVATLTAGTDDTDVWLLPVLPVNRSLFLRGVKLDRPSLHTPTRAEVAALNRVVAAQAEGRPRVHRVELPELLDESGELRREYTLDGLHLNGAGLTRLAAHLRHDLLGDSSRTAAAPAPPRPIVP